MMRAMSDRSEQPWQWDESLYLGSASHYAEGRMPYPAVLIETLVRVLGLDGSQHLLDLGCGPGSLTIPLSEYVDRAVGLDPDDAMLSQAQLLAGKAQASKVEFVCSRA